MKIKRFFASKNKNLIGTYSLRSQIVANFALLSIISVTIVGVTALWINYRYLDTAKREQSLSMISSFYEALENRINDLVYLSTTHLALDFENVKRDPVQLKKHLEEIHLGIPQVDTIILCNESGDIIAYSGNTIPINNCNLKSNPEYIAFNDKGLEQAWLLRGRTFTDTNSISSTLILGIQMNDAVLSDMCDHCDLYHSILYNDKMIATSFGSKLSNKTEIRTLPGKFSDVEFQQSYKMGDHIYYISHFPLNSAGLEVEVALDITSIRQDQRQQEFILTLVILVVVFISILMGAFLAQYIQKPLTRLVKITTQHEHLDLSEPIDVKTNLQEVIDLSQVLENSRKRIENALTSLQKEKVWNDLLLESIMEGIVILQNETIIYFSPGAQRITSWKDSDTKGKSINDILVLSDQSINFLESLPPVGEKIRSNFTLKDGSKKIISITHAELVQDTLENPQTVLVLRDVSQEEVLSHLLGSFLGNITHEFRTPLTALSASIEILTEEIDDLTPSETHELLNSIHLSTLNLENLIENLLEGSSIETGRFHVRPHPSDLRLVINTACETMTPLLLKYGQSIDVNLPKELPLVLIDSRRINQVLLNMISNASKYGPSDEQISINVVLMDKFIEISIGDHGEGVPEEYQNKIFSGYVLTHNGSGRMQKGSGLGLSVSQAIIKAHGGEVGVRNRNDGGAEFWFTVPISGGS